jgi:hypothetical protein
MVELLRTVFDSIGSGADVEPSQTREIVSKFTAWLQVYGSDNAVRSFHKFMQASYHNAPPAVLLRLYSEVVMAIRRDLGEPNTEVTLVDLLGMRITDIYETFAPGLQLDEQEFFGQNEWHPLGEGFPRPSPAAKRERKFAVKRPPSRSPLPQCHHSPPRPIVPNAIGWGSGAAGRRGGLGCRGASVAGRRGSVGGGGWGAGAAQGARSRRGCAGPGQPPGRDRRAGRGAGPAGAVRPTRPRPPRPGGATLPRQPACAGRG